MWCAGVPVLGLTASCWCNSWLFALHLVYLLAELWAQNGFRTIAELLAYASAVGSTVSLASDLTAGENDVEEIDTGGTEQRCSP